MDTEPLFRFLAAITQLSAAFVAELTAGLQQEVYKPRQIILAGGQADNRLWYLESGFARSYYYDDDGREHTLRFWNEKDVIFSYAGFWNEPSGEYLEILEPSFLYSFSYISLHQLLVHYPEALIIVSTVVLRYQARESFRKRLYTLNAEERYLQLRKDSPFIFKKAPLKMIASYLNMSRENLSRIISKERH
jgi:CRP-like cAMP-binding protein